MTKKIMSPEVANIKLAMSARRNEREDFITYRQRSINALIKEIEEGGKKRSEAIAKLDDDLADKRA